MRIVIDMQGAQTASRFRGIGRYSLSLADAIIRNRGNHDVIVALSANLPESLESVRSQFAALLPKENIRVWETLVPVSESSAAEWVRETAEMTREAFMAALNPDVLLVSSMFEGLTDNAVTSVGAFTDRILTAAVLYDLIPYANPQLYLANPLVEQWYQRKFEYLRRADLLLAISNSSRSDGITHLAISPDKIENISADADSHFQCRQIDVETEASIRQRYGLDRPFLLYTGGIDPRKNIEGLISAFAGLAGDIRATHQLAIVCAVQPETRAALGETIQKLGLSDRDVVLTGFVPEDDLVLLYNLCKLFVFPSWQEGFGLPALEAMRCGAPVIGSNTSSIPEIIGNTGALFDPYSVESITKKMQEALTNHEFRQALALHGKRQANTFSWNKTAKQAIAAMETLRAAARPHRNVTMREPLRRPKLAYISPLPPVHSGIAEYSTQLIPELSRYYDIEFIVPPHYGGGHGMSYRSRSAAWFKANSDSYDFVIYHFGNSQFHAHMFELLEEVPGVVVLHDFFLSGIQEYLEATGTMPYALSRELYRAHGYKALLDRLRSSDPSEAVWRYPCNFSVLDRAIGIVVHSKYCKTLVADWYGPAFAQQVAHVPHLRAQPKPFNRSDARSQLGLDADDFVVCSFGILGSHKLNHRLLAAWSQSRLAENPKCKLIFVGECSNREYCDQLLGVMKKAKNKGSIQITGWVDDDTFHSYLSVADVSVQLRALSRGETSGAVLHSMNYGIATVVNSNGSMADLPSDAVWMLREEFNDEELVHALETLMREGAYRSRLSERARQVVSQEHNPRICADLYRESIETFYAKAKLGTRELVRSIAGLNGVCKATDAELAALASKIAKSIPKAKPARELFVDISVLAERDARTGIQRVVRGLLKALIDNPPPGYRVEPVRAVPASGQYYYARRFTLGFIQCADCGLNDEPVEPSIGDVFLGLDLYPPAATAMREALRSLQNQGVAVHFVVYDLLPVLHPEMFPEHVTELHKDWLHAITSFDRAICISKSVAEELRAWVETNRPEQLKMLDIRWVHLGADVSNARDMPAFNVESELPHSRQRPSFLMVGTVEPRKGHEQVLGAFERLWGRGIDVALVLVGKEGWKVEKLSGRLRSHVELGRRLFWLENVKDKHLERIYSKATCLLAASIGEGFGLPIVEAASFKLPIIARDIPVFREIAGDNAYYFSGLTDQDLSSAIEDWLALHAVEATPKSSNIRWLTWGQSRDQLVRAMFDHEGGGAIVATAPPVSSQCSSHTCVN